MAGAVQVNLQDAVNQIIQLGESIAGLRKDVTNLQGEHIELRQQLREARGQGGGKGSSNRGYEKSELRSMKAVYPDKLNPSTNALKDLGRRL